MEAVAVPDLIGAVAHALVQEGVVGLVRRAADLFRVDAFRPFPEHIGDGHSGVFIHLDRDRGLHPQRHAVGRMADILALGVIGGAVVGLAAKDKEFVVHFVGEPAAHPVGLARFVAGGELDHVHREIARLQEHGGEHFLTVHLLEGEGALIGCAVMMQDTLGLRPGFPERRRLERGLVAAFLEAAVHRRRARRTFSVRSRTEQADVLGAQAQRHEQAKDAGFVSRSHKNRCLNCSCP